MYNVSVEKMGETPWYSIHAYIGAEKGDGTQGAVFSCVVGERGRTLEHNITSIL